MALIPLDRMAAFMDIPAEARRLLEKPEREMSLSVNLKLARDRVVFCDAYVVYHNLVLGPAKGGIRISPTASLEGTRNLAAIMTYKSALVGLPFGGGKSAIRVPPGGLDECERHAIVKEFVHMIREELEAGHYVPAPDMGSGPGDMAVIFGELHRPECVTGKPVRIGGLPGRLEATGRGVAAASRLAAGRILGKPLADVSVAVQGFGNVGRWTAAFLSQAGARVVAVGNVGGAVRNPKGLDIGRLFEHAPGRDDPVAEFPGGEAISNEELLALDVDILVPAAVERAVTRENAASVRARCVIEGANDPVTAEAEETLVSRGTVVLPDFFCNSGGVIASYIEWRNGRSGNQTDREEVFEFIDAKIARTFDAVEGIRKGGETSYREAATLLSLRELIEAMRERNWL